MIRCLAEVKWLVIGNKYPFVIYSDHDALQHTDDLKKGQTEKG